MYSWSFAQKVPSWSSQPHTSKYGVEKTPALSRPDGGSANGVSLRSRANTYASINPSQNTGIDTPTLATAIVPVSTTVLWRRAAITPIGTPTSTANVSADNASSVVSGSRSIRAG